MSRIDLTGEKIGQLTVIEFSHKKLQGTHSAYFWKCKCECGTIKDIRRDHLREGRVISCGCVKTTSYQGVKKMIESIPMDAKGCKPWPGRNERNGYGRTRIEGTRWSTHRLSYYLFNGDIPSNMMVCHRCDNRKCINPDHLFLGTHDDNMKDMVDKKRQMHGETHHKAKISRTDVIHIRKSHAELINALSNKYDISKTTIYLIINKKIWREK